MTTNCHHLQSLCDDISRELEASQASDTSVARDNRLRDAERDALILLRGIVFARAELAVWSKQTNGQPIGT